MIWQFIKDFLRPNWKKISVAILLLLLSTWTILFSSGNSPSPILFIFSPYLYIQFLFAFGRGTPKQHDLPPMGLPDPTTTLLVFAGFVVIHWVYSCLVFYVLNRLWRLVLTKYKRGTIMTV